jgi:DNA-directed RNA polymerase subunit RPC12/RpoP
MEKSSSDSFLLFSCPGCNAQLQFRPDTQQMACEYCGTHVKIDNGQPVQEKELHKQLFTAENLEAGKEEKVYKCTRCGAESTIPATTTTFVCAYCNFDVVNAEAHKSRNVQPTAIIPFKIDRQKAIEIFKQWAGKGKYAPRDIGKVALQEELRGIYLPFWTHSAETFSKWRGEAGEYYYVDLEEKDSKGNTVTRREQMTKWISRSGTYDCAFDEVLVNGSKEVPHQSISSILPFQLEQLVNYNESYLAGFESMVYDVDVNESFERAKNLMQDELNVACKLELAIDTSRGLKVNSNYSNQTYKHILLPLWMCTFVYKGKNYPFLINGQTGQIAGIKPESRASALKVSLIWTGVLTILYILSRIFPNH